MTAHDRGEPAAIRMALLASGLGISWQVMGRATRDALFLSYFDVTSLPRMVMVSALISLGAALLVGRLLSRHGPGKLAPTLYLGSVAVVLVAWLLLGMAPRAAAVLMFIHISGFGGLLVSVLWSLANERFDPRTAKKVFSRMATAATVGGVAGGLVAERVGAIASVGGMLPMLALVHVIGAFLSIRMRPEAPAVAGRAAPDTRGGLRTMFTSRFLLLLALLGVLMTVSEGLLDYVFKAAARGTVTSGEGLLRLFALFYAASNLLGIAVSSALSKPALEKLGLARTVSLLPWSVAAGGITAIALPGMATALGARLLEAVTRNSLYRSGAELLLTPLPPPEKRSVKPLLDVGAPRIGDVISSLLVQLALALSLAHSQTLMLAFAVMSATVCILLTYRVHQGYVTALERGLKSRAVHLDLPTVRDKTTRNTMSTMPQFALPDFSAEAGAAAALADPVAVRLAQLRSADPMVVRGALDSALLEPSHVAQAIALLARDDVTAGAREALAVVGARHVGQLVDALLDPASDAVVRRRLPAVLCRIRSPRAVEGLLAGLADERFEVRFRCGRALAMLVHAAPELLVSAERVHAAVLREATVGRDVWESQQTHGHEEPAEPLPFDALLKDRASRSLEHVFTMLALVLPREPLEIAYRGLHAGDVQLRGTALEYLETALPPAIREKLWPFLDEDAPREGAPRPRDVVVADLLRARKSIAMSVEALRARERDPA